jgi:hypothetical protein
VARTLAPGSGCVLFRDYAEGDLAQARLEGMNSGAGAAGSGQRKISERFYTRGDGTLCYYFGVGGRVTGSQGHRVTGSQGGACVVQVGGGGGQRSP